MFTIDALAAAAGLTVRTARYYASLGLLPPPERRGRVAFYSELHLARLQLVRALQDHGLTLSAIESYLARIPIDAGVPELSLHRMSVLSWSAQPRERLTAAELETRAGRPLEAGEVDLMLGLGILVRIDDSEFEVRPGFDATLGVLDLGISTDGIRAAGEAIDRHTQALATELTDIFARQVVAPFRAQGIGDVETIVGRLRQLTLEAVTSGFQRAANQVITRSLGDT